MKTNLGSFHKGPQLVCLSLCLRSSDIFLSECQPSDGTDMKIIHNKFARRMAGMIKTQDVFWVSHSP